MRKECLAVVIDSRVMVFANVHSAAILPGQLYLYLDHG